MIKKVLCVLIILTVLFGASLTAFSADAPSSVELGFDLETLSSNIILVNADTGTTVFEKNADERVHPASTTKIMTVALAMSMCDDLNGTVVTVPDDVWASFEGLYVSNAGLKAGEELTMYELCCCMMLQSANEAAVTVAEYYGYDSFISMMNAKAAELGCTDTHFNNPHGAFIADHYTTARDMMKITRWAMSVPGFWEMSQLARYDKRQTNMNDAVTLATTNLMQDPTSGYYTAYIKGIKTGTVDEAGRCLVSAAQKDGVTYVLVTLGGPFEASSLFWDEGVSSYTDARRIYDWAFSTLSLKNVVDESTVVTDVGLRYSNKKDNLLLYPSGELYTLVRNDADLSAVEITYETSIPESVNAPIDQGDVIGSAKVFFAGGYVGDVELISREAVEFNSFAMLMDTLSDILTSTVAKIVIAVLVFIVVLYVYYMLIVVPAAQRKKRRARNAANKMR